VNPDVALGESLPLGRFVHEQLARRDYLYARALAAILPGSNEGRLGLSRGAEISLLA